MKVDVVPAGPGLRAAGKLVWPRSGHEMQLVGMDLVFEHAVTEPLGHTALRIASLPTIVILKMNSWLDRFEDRERDLADIGHVLEDAVRPDDDRRFDDHIVELAMDYELVCAFLIGEDVGRIAKDHHRRRVDEFLAKVGVWPRRRREAKPTKKAPRCVHQRGFLVGPGGPMARGSKPLAKPFLREKSGHVNLHRGGQPRSYQPKRPSNAGRSLFARAVQAQTGRQARPPMVPPKEPPATRSQETPTVVLSRPPASGSPVLAS